VKTLGVIFLAAALLTGAADIVSAQDAAARAQICAACHGEDGNSNTPLVPSLAGQPAFFLTTQLVLMREQVRPVAAMEGLLNGLDDSVLVGLAEHFAKMPVKNTDETRNAERVARGKALSDGMRCTSCHGANLNGQEQMPRLTGQRIDYMVAAMKSVRDSTRPGADPLMANVVAGVSDADLQALAEYVSGK
jgi:cytochrome c553